MGLPGDALLYHHGMATVGIFIVLLVAFIALHRWYIRPRKKARRLEIANRLHAQARQQQPMSPQAGLNGDGSVAQNSAAVGAHAGGVPEGAGGSSGGAGGSGHVDGAGTGGSGGSGSGGNGSEGSGTGSGSGSGGNGGSGDGD